MPASDGCRECLPRPTTDIVWSDRLRKIAPGSTKAFANLGVAIDPNGSRANFPSPISNWWRLPRRSWLGPGCSSWMRRPRPSTAVRSSSLFAALRRLRDDGTAIIFVSHRLEEICDRRPHHGAQEWRVRCHRSRVGHHDGRSGATHGGSADAGGLPSEAACH